MSSKPSDSQAAWQLVENAQSCLRNDDFPGAIEFFGQAVREFKLRGDHHGVSHTLRLLAATHQDVGNFEQAARYHQEGLEVARTLNKAYSLVVEHLDGLGISHSNMGRWHQAIEYFDQAIAETRKPIVGMRERRAHIFQHLANAYVRYTNQYEEAVRLYDDAIAISKDCGDPYNVACCLTFKGAALTAMGQIEQGLQLHEQAREIAEAEGYEQLLGACYAHLAASYFHLGKTEIAKRYGEQALKIDKKYGNRQGMNRDLWLLGRIHTFEGNDQAALEAYQEAFLLARSIGDTKNVTVILDLLARVYQRRHQAYRARHYYEEALTLCREIGDKRSEIHITLGLASLGTEQEMFETLEQALTSAREHGFTDLEQEVETGLARLCDQGGDYDGARMRYKRSVALLEQMRSSYQVEEHLRAFSESNADVYERLVDLCLMLGYDTEAFEYAERARARVLNNLRRTRRVRPLRTLQSHQIARYREVCDSIISHDRKIQRLLQAGQSIKEDLAERLRLALIDEAELVLAAKRSAAETWAVDSFDVIGLAGLRERLSSLGQSILVLAYYTTATNSYVFVVSKKGFEVRPLEINSAALRELIYAFREALDVGATVRDPYLAVEEEVGDSAITPQAAKSKIYLPHTQRLFDVLIRPIEAECLAADHLCIIPHGPLHFLPFHALHDGTHYLIERRPISYAPSATALSESLAEKFVAVENVLALGDPDGTLGAARPEVEAIHTLFGAEHCRKETGAQATRALVIDAGSGSSGRAAFDGWHFATHAVFIQSAPHLSYLQLAPGEEGDGRLFAYMIAGMERVARLNVLSGCRTAMTREARGDELNGLLFAFMAAGAQTAVASLWPVADRSTATLMKAFYKHHMSSGRLSLSLATALQKAQITLLRAPGTASPYYWAPFVLHGNWNPVLEAPAEERSAIHVEPSQVMSSSHPLVVSGAGARVRAETLLRQGESCLARARIEGKKKEWSWLPEEERAELNKAIETFSQAIEAAPDLSAAYRQRGIAYYKLSENEKAMADLKQAVEFGAADALAAACLGLLLADQGQDRQMAIEMLEHAFRLDPKIQRHYPRANTIRFQSALERMRAEQTVEECTRLLTSSPHDPRLFVERGYAYWRLSYTSDKHQEHQQKAISDFKRALELDGRCALAATRLAWIEYSSHRAGAIEAYTQVVEMDPQCAEAHLRLAQAYQFKHQVERAIVEYQAALTCDPAIQHASCGLGETYLELGEWEHASEAFETELKVNPNSFTAHLYLMEMYTARGRYEEAAREYEEGLRTTEHSLSEGELGVVLSDEVTAWIRELARKVKAERHPAPTQQRRLQRSELQAHLSKANALANSGRTHEAIAVYTELIDRDPTYALAYAYRGGCYGTVDEHDRAFEDLRQAIALDPGCAVAYFNLYSLHYNRWELDQAQEALDHAILLDPELAKRVKSTNEGQASQEISAPPTSNLDQLLEQAYQTSGIKCDHCQKPLRKPLGGIIVTSGSDAIEKLLEGTPYYCLNCGTTSCFECSAESSVSKVLCRKCGSEMTVWGQAKEAERARAGVRERRAKGTDVCVICLQSTRLVEAGLCSRCYEASKRAVDYIASHGRQAGICEWCSADMETQIGEMFVADTGSKIECKKCAKRDMEKYGKFV